MAATLQLDRHAQWARKERLCSAGSAALYRVAMSTLCGTRYRYCIQVSDLSALGRRHSDAVAGTVRTADTACVQQNVMSVRVGLGWLNRDQTQTGISLSSRMDDCWTCMRVMLTLSDATVMTVMTVTARVQYQCHILFRWRKIPHQFLAGVCPEVRRTLAHLRVSDTDTC
jgi:hypothetical protein